MFALSLTMNLRVPVRRGVGGREGKQDVHDTGRACWDDGVIHTGFKFHGRPFCSVLMSVVSNKADVNRKSVLDLRLCMKRAEDVDRAR
jgi:hypothetical protein